MLNVTRRSLIAGLVLLIGGMGALADSETQFKHPLDRELQACIEKDSSTLGMKQCNWKFQKKWDAELNRFYALLGGDQNRALREAQLAWIRMRDAEWRWIEARYGQIYKESGGGTMWGLLATGDKMEVVRKRALELRAFYLFKKCGLTGDCDAQNE